MSKDEWQSEFFQALKLELPAVTPTRAGYQFKSFVIRPLRWDDEQVTIQAYWLPDKNPGGAVAIPGYVDAKMLDDSPSAAAQPLIMWLRTAGP